MLKGVVFKYQNMEGFKHLLKCLKYLQNYVLKAANLKVLITSFLSEDIMQTCNKQAVTVVERLSRATIKRSTILAVHVLWTDMPNDNI